MTYRHALLLAALWLGLSGLARADKADAPIAPREASQLVTGHIEVDAQGAVTGFTLDDRKVLPAQAQAFLDRSIPQWRFKPVLKDGQPVAARSDMSLRLVLMPAGDKQYALGVRGVAFGDKSVDPATRLRARKLTPPEYPRVAMHYGGTADVYLLVKVGRDGKVLEAVEEQVNLTGYADPRERDEIREVLTRAALNQAKRWQFTPPRVGDEADDPFWTARVPVVFNLWGTALKPGEWNVYEPGPRRERPEWARSDDDNPNFSPDALPPGDAYAGGQTLHMLSMGGAP